MSGELAIEASGLVKTFGETRAVDGVDLVVPKGSVYGVLGPNGAGKTTTIRMLATLIRPDGGEARVLGHDIVREAEQVRRSVSLTGQLASVDEDLTGRENLVLLGKLLGLGNAGAKQRADELLEAFGLEQAATKLVKNYSGGMRRRLDISASIVVTPELMFLDEPTTGLDPRSRNQVWDIVRALVAGGTTILLCTQYLEEADQLAGGIAVIDHGKVIAEGTPAQLKASVGSGALKVRLLDPAQRAEAERVLASGLDGEVDAPGNDPSQLSAPCADADRAAAAVGALTAAGIGVADFSLGQPSLDEVFLALTGRPAEGDDNELEEQAAWRAVDATAGTGVDEERVRKAISSTERPAPAGPAATVSAFAWRAMLKVRHVPEQLLDVTVTPVMFTLMFTYLFGGAISGSTAEYRDYIVPGILVQTILFTTVYSGVVLNTDMTKGVVDRFRSLPIWRGGPLVGALLGDSARYVLSGLVIVVLGLILGFRPDGGVVGVAAAMALVIVFAFGMSWIFTCLGLLRTPNAVLNAGFMGVFPLIFISNIFVKEDTLPRGLKEVVEVNPITILTTATRDLMAGNPAGGDVAICLAVAAALTVVFASLTVRLYGRA